MAASTTRHLLASLCAFAAIRAFAAEIPVTPPVYGPAPGNQYYAGAASDGDRYLVAWVDERAEVPQAYATRVSGDGTVLDPNGIRVASGALTYYYPSILWSGSSWFILSSTCSSIELVRMDGNGVVLDAAPRVLPVQAGCPGVSAASDGRVVAIGYIAGSPMSEERVLVLDGDGNTVADILLASGESQAVVPALGWNGTSFVAVWNGRAARFDRNGVLGPVHGVPFGGNTMRIASDGRDYLVVSGSLVSRMTADFAAEFLGNLPFASAQSVFWTGSSYVVSGVVPFVENGSENRGRIDIVLLDRDGHVLGQRLMQSSDTGVHAVNGAAVATNGRNLLVAWHDRSEAHDVPYKQDDTYAAVVSLPDLTSGPRQLLSIAAGPQFHPVTAAGANNQLTVWWESTGLYARRQWRDGHSDDAPLRLTALATAAAVVFDGTSFIVATAEGGAVVTRRVPATGALRVDGEWRSAGTQNPRDVALASDGAVTLAAWFDQGIYAARVGADGALLDTTPLEVAPASLAGTTQRISISPDGGGEFLVVWGGTIPACLICSPSSPAEGGTLRAARVTSTLTLLDRPPIALAVPIDFYDSRSDPASPRYDPQHSLAADDPSAAWNGNEWLVVWNRSFRAAAGTREEIRGRRIAHNGTLLDGAASDPGVLVAQNAFAPTVAWTGAAYLLGWYEGLPTYRTYQPARAFLHVHTATFDRLGGALSNARTLGESPESDPISIAVFHGSTSLAYARVGDDPRYGGVSRAFVDVPPPEPRRRAARR